MATGDDTLTPDDAVDVLEEILPAQNQSYELGLKLKVPEHEVESIHSTFTKPRNRLLHVLIAFAKQVEPRPTWRVIVDALRSPAVNVPQLAERVEAAHFPDTIATRAVPPHSTVLQTPITTVQPSQQTLATGETDTPSEMPASPDSRLLSSREVKDMMEKLDRQFDELKQRIRECLESYKIAVKRVADALTSLPADEVEEHKQFLESHITVLFKAANHSELFGTMNFHWNYLNYPLLDHLIRKFKLKEVKGDMEAYKNNIQQFREKTPLTIFCQTQKRRHIKPPSEFEEMVAEFDWPNDVTLEVVEQFRQEYACHYGLHECAMMLTVVRPNCFIVTWFIPESIVEKLKGNVPRDILKKHLVKRLEIAGTCVYCVTRKQQQQQQLQVPTEPPATSSTSTAVVGAATAGAMSDQLDLQSQVQEVQQPLRRKEPELTRVEETIRRQQQQIEEMRQQEEQLRSSEALIADFQRRELESLRTKRPIVVPETRTHSTRPTSQPVQQEMAEKNATSTSTTASAAVKAMEKLSAQLSCSVCLEEYSRPRVLPCLHVFCEDCLEKMVGTQRDKQRAPCPNCRKPAPLPEGGVSSLPAAFYIHHLLEVREALEKVRNPEKAQCDKCGEGEVQGFCRDCGQFICQLCLDMHRKWKEFQNHEISSLDDVEETASKMMTPKKVTTLCTRHPTEPIKIYCETCDELICRDCTVKTHRDHNYDLIPDAFPKHRDAILACLQPVKTELAGVVETISELKARSSRLDGQGVEVKGKVDTEIDKLHAILDAHRRDLHSEIDGKVHQGKKELAVQIDQHELRQVQLSSCVEFVEGSLQSGTQQEVLSMKRQVEQRTQQMTDEFKPQQLKLGPEKVLRVVCADLRRACQTLAQVKFEMAQFEGVHVKTISRIEGPRHLAFATTGEMVVCEWNGNCVTVFDSSYRKLRSFGSTGAEESRLNCPLGVAISSDNTVFIAACHCVKKFTLEGQFIASVGSEGSGQLQFNTPWAIAYNDTNNRVYVCDTCNHRITILNHDLTFHTSFGSEGSDAGQFSLPEGISVDTTGHVLVADYDNKRIQVFDGSGRYLSSITHTTPGRRLQGPVSVAVGPDDCVYVVEQSSRVSAFDENGEYIKSFGKEGNDDGEFNGPYAIAVGDDGGVYVSDTDNNRVQVFM